MKDFGKIDFETLDIPTCEREDLTKARLGEIYKEMLVKKNLDLKPQKNSPGFRPSAEQARQVSILACLGIDPKDIAMVVNIEEPLLKLFYARELKVQLNLANAMVARRALGMALDGRHPDMTKFWLKTRAGWKETSAVEVSGKNGGPVEISSAKARLKTMCGLDDEPEDVPYKDEER